MKDRIKELAIESKDSWGYENWERFAELIIQECAEVASRAALQEDYPAWYLIEKHFEVEEC